MSALWSMGLVIDNVIVSISVKTSLKCIGFPKRLDKENGRGKDIEHDNLA